MEGRSELRVRAPWWRWTAAALALLPVILLVAALTVITHSAGADDGSGTGAGLLCDCDDGIACNGIELCNPLNGECLPVPPLDCSGLSDDCNDGVCIEPLGVCVPLPKADGFGCNDGNACSSNDVCLSGICTGSPGADSDADGFCDQEEATAHCNPDDFDEIPPQANVYSGGKTVAGGEILVTFNAPADRDVLVASNPTCAPTGTCDLTAGFCTAGAVRNPCGADSDCDQPAGLCRVVVNYADSPDLTLAAFLKVRGAPKQDVLSLFSPVSPGCSRKVDIALPSGFRGAKLKLKSVGTTSGKRRVDRDKVKFFNQ